MNKLTMFGLSIVVFFALVAMFAPFIAPYDPSKIDI
ncbi:MAG: peptide ABC transporter permease, partial [Candidatus Omnitrophota bacterium]